MRSILWIVFLLVTIHEANCQDRIWGSLPYGGQGVGLVYNFNSDGSEFKIVKEFVLETKNPSGRLNDFNDGYLYGTTSYKNSFESGEFFRMKSDGTEFSIIKKFSGESPKSVITSFNGKLYGTTTSQNGCSIFSVNKDGTDYTAIYHFSNTCPQDGLLLASDNQFYGTTSSGGEFNNGTIFKFNPTTSQFSTIYSFATWGGASPNGFLIEGNDGFLFGTTTSGYGTPVGGSVFKIAKDGSSFTSLKGFADVSQGRDIYGGLTKSEDGTLFGSFNYGGQFDWGGIFKLNPNGTGYQIIHHFKDVDGKGPRDELFYSNGYVYGATTQGGVNELGTIYKLKADGSEFIKIYDLPKDRGMNSVTFTFLSDQLFYTAYSGGTSKLGAIVKVDEIGKQGTVIKEFNPADGGQPTGKLVKHSNGNIYGTTYAGGDFGRGTLYKININSNEFEVIHHFQSGFTCCNSDLVENIDGKLLGIVRTSDPTKNDSYIFEYDLNSNKFSLVFSASNLYLNSIDQIFTKEYFGTARLADGISSSLFFLDSNFQFKNQVSTPDYLNSSWVIKSDDPTAAYGTEGKSGGIISNYNIASGKFSNFFFFGSNTTAIGPTGKLVMTKDTEKLIGTTVSGGALHGGIIFSVKKDGSQFETLYDFKPENNTPLDGLVNINDSLFYGVINKQLNYTNDDTDGAVYKFSIKDGFSIVKNFKDINGTFPTSGLTLTKDDTPEIKLYGRLDFGAVEVGKSEEKSFQIKNFGSGDLKIESIDLPEGFFTLSENFLVSPGQVIDVSIRFEPSEELDFVGDLFINSNIGLSKLPISGSSYIVVGIGEGAGTPINIYPNPAENKIVIQNRGLVGQVSIVNSIGIEVLVEGTSSHESLDLDLESLLPGIYVLTFRSQSRIIKKKIIKK
jgi:uncharacterized repeat protein (TIGR03803 family)